MRRQSVPEMFSNAEIPGLREYLNRSDFFSSCSKEVQDTLLGHFHYRHFETGEYLIQSGNKATTLFLLLKGKVHVVSDKYESVLTELGPGMMFGEIGALFGVPRVASVIAKSSGFVAIIDKNTLKEILGSDQILWNHLKGIALSRYNTTFTVKSKCPHITVPDKEEFLSKTIGFKDLPKDILRRLAELCEATGYKSESIVNFFSPRAKHELYLVKSGALKAHYMDGTSKILNEGESFKSYDKTLDFVKSSVDKTILIVFDVQEASVILASSEDQTVQDIGEKIFEVLHLTDNIDANSSLTSAAGKQAIDGLNSIVNSSQFSRKRRNSLPVFSDLGLENGAKIIGFHQSIPIEVAQTPSKLINDESDLKTLLLNVGVNVPGNVILYHENRLTLTPIKNELTDSILLLVATVLGSNLHVLNLSDCHLLTSSGVLAVWLHCPELQKVSLDGCWNLDDSAFSTLARCQCAETLKEINVAHCWRMTTKIFGFLGPNITKLDLSYCKGLDDRTWPALTRFSNKLRSLRLRRCYGITDNSFEGLFGAQFNELEFLDLSECSFLTDSAVSAILSSSPNLRHLNLSFSLGITGSFLLAQTSLLNLRSLNLSHLKEVVTETFCIRLTRVCGNMEELYLDGCDLVDDDVIGHFNDENLPKLRILSVNDCNLISQSTLNFIKLKYN